MRHVMGVLLPGLVVATTLAGCTYFEKKPEPATRAVSHKSVETREQARAAASTSETKDKEKGKDYQTNYTAEDQSTKPNDVELTRMIRRDLMNRDELSMNAKNVKIITQDGAVTLKGEVANAREKEIIDEAAYNRAGRTKVTDELIVR